MISYVRIPAWGAFVAAAIVVGMIFARRRARQLGLEREAIASAMTWGVLGGFLLSHVFDVLAYRADELVRAPWMVFDPRFGWSVSSFGGFFGGFLSLWLWARRRRQPLLPYVDATAFGMAPAWVLGRLGCFSVHDHIGRASDFFLAVRFPDGPRHDLGLYEAIVAAALTAAFLLSFRRRLPAGAYVKAACLAYAPARFLLDFLRADDVLHADPRFLGLTPGQYGAVAVLCLGLVAIGARHPGEDAAGHDGVVSAGAPPPSSGSARRRWGSS